MTEFHHGGDILTAQSRYGGTVLDFSANLNPLGMPEGVRLAAQRAVEGAVHYPDPFCRALSAGIAERDGVEPGWVLCGNGAADLIFRLPFALRPRRVLLTAPTFSEYEQAAAAAGAWIDHHYLHAEQGFAVTQSLLLDLAPGVDMAFLCNPNNPTGMPIDHVLLEDVMRLCAAREITLVVDECFLELSDGAQTQGLAGYLSRYPNLIVLRAFTKSYAMPGLRLGYCLCANGETIEKLRRCGQAWAVSAPAQAAGLAALQEPDYPARARVQIQAARAALTQQLLQLGLTVFPSQVNYLLFRASGVEDLQARMGARGVLIRACANYVGLGSDYYRVAVRTTQENERLIQALREVL